jgi:peptidoglycan/xylan/chitin deacetylase (PgdA/CDA1 family)
MSSLRWLPVCGAALLALAVSGACTVTPPDPNAPQCTVGGACLASDGCQGVTESCSGDGLVTSCRAQTTANACGVCGGAPVDGVNAECTTVAGDPGYSVCDDSGTSTVCAKTVVTLTFDDTFGDTYDAASQLDTHGLRATFFVNAPRLGHRGDYMTLDQVLDLQKRGHEIGGHTLDHPHLPTLSAGQQGVEICNDRAKLVSLGLDVRHFAYPFGEADADTEAAARSCNYVSARGVGNLRDDGGPLSAESFSPPDMFRLRADTSVVDSDTLDALQARVTDAEATGGWVIINMHHVCDTCGTTEVRSEVFSTFLDWLAPHVAGTTTYVREVRRVLPGALLPQVLSQGNAAPQASGGTTVEDEDCRPR